MAHVQKRRVLLEDGETRYHNLVVARALDASMTSSA